MEPGAGRPVHHPAGRSPCLPAGGARAPRLPARAHPAPAPGPPEVPPGPPERAPLARGASGPGSSDTETPRRGRGRPGGRTQHPGSPAWGRPRAPRPAPPRGSARPARPLAPSATPTPTLRGPRAPLTRPGPRPCSGRSRHGGTRAAAAGIPPRVGAPQRPGASRGLPRGGVQGLPGSGPAGSAAGSPQAVPVRRGPAARSPWWPGR